MPRRTPTHRGAGLFAEPAPQEKTAAYTANIDGGSRGNPGPAAYGVVIRNPRGEIVARLKKYIGRMTNNVAEYYGLIAALDYAQSQSIRALRVESDSELLVNQMRGRYKVKSADLRPLFERAKKMSQTFASFHIEHVYREQNAEADKLANEALDETSGATSAIRNPKLETRNLDSAAKNDSSETRLKYFDGQMLTAEDLEEEQEYNREMRRRHGRVVHGNVHLAEKLDWPDGTEVEVVVRRKKKP
jgi:ribonuclease HI